VGFIDMLKKALRLQKKEDFDRVFQGGRPIFFEALAARVRSNGQEAFRLGFSFSKKHLPLAVERNRFRRVLSALVEKNPELWPEGVDIVFATRFRPRSLSEKAWATPVRELLERLSRR
jgi:ribonuclease P protein component